MPLSILSNVMLLRIFFNFSAWLISILPSNKFLFIFKFSLSLNLFNFSRLVSSSLNDFSYSFDSLLALSSTSFNACSNSLISLSAELVFNLLNCCCSLSMFTPLSSKLINLSVKLYNLSSILSKLLVTDLLNICPSLSTCFAVCA